MKTITFLSIGLLAAPIANAAVVAAYEFNAAGDLAAWAPGGAGTTQGTTGLTVSGGTLNGTANGNDPQLKTTPPSALSPAAGEAWTTIELRVREIQDEAPTGPVSFNNTGLNVTLNGSSLGGAFTGVASGDDFFTLTMNISGFGGGTGTITSIRVDPIGGVTSNSNSQTDGNSFEVDYIRISDSLVVPEPSSALLLGFASLMVLRRRR